MATKQKQIPAANKLDELPPRKGGSGRESIYPWDEWFDGSVYELIEGKHYPTKSFITMAYARAKKAGKTLTVRQLESGKGVAIQATNGRPAKKKS